MSAISKLIFNNASHYVTSPFGARSVINTSAGATSSYHSGTDYGTNNLKIPQYAIEDGYCFDSAKASDGANYVWVIYPRIKKAFLHYHLDSRKITAGTKVKKGTLLGYTGMTGKATGIHLHLGIKDLSKLSASQINNMTYASLQNCSYVDPEKVAYTAVTAKATNAFLPSKRYFAKGDKSSNIGLIAKFIATNKLEGNVFGPYLEAVIKVFQKENGLEADGKIGPKTLAKLEAKGFKHS